MYINSWDQDIVIRLSQGAACFESGLDVQIRAHQSVRSSSVTHTLSAMIIPFAENREAGNCALLCEIQLLQLFSFEDKHSRYGGRRK